MKFFDFYDDVILEARYSSDEKFDWIASNMETWLFDKMVRNPVLMRSMRWASKFKEYLKNNTNEPYDTDSNLVMALDRIEDFLQKLSKKDSQDIIKDVTNVFPDIKSKIARFGKPEVAGRRGRPFGSKNKPRAPKDDISIDKVVSAPQVIDPVLPEPEEITPQPVKKLGRPKIYSDEFTSMERSKYKREGPAMIKSLEAKAESLDNEVNLTIARIKKIMADIEKRKKFFGIEN